MERKRSVRLMVLTVYCGLLIASQWPMALGTLRRLPVTVDYLLHNYDFIMQHDWLAKSLFTIPLDVLRAMCVVFVMPAGVFFLWRSREGGRQLIIYGCLFLFLHTIFGFVTTYPGLVERNMHAHLPSVQWARQLALTEGGPPILAGNELLFIQSVLVSLFCFLVPIYYLHRPRHLRKHLANKGSGLCF